MTMIRTLLATSCCSLLAVACGGTSLPEEPQPNDPPNAQPNDPPPTPACDAAAGQCDGCPSCFDTCVCGTGDSTACAIACRAGGSGGSGAGGSSGSGAGGSGAGGSGAGGTSGSGAGGTSGSGAGGTSGSGAGGTGGASTGGAAGTAAGGTAGAGTGGAAGSSTGGTGGVPPATGGAAGVSGSGGTGGVPAFQTASITFDTQTVGPGQEIFKCQYFPNPFGGQDVEVARSESFMTRGSHHMFVFYEDTIPPGGETVHDCSGLEYKTTIHGAAQPNQVLSYPPDVGRAFPGNQQMRILVHFLNTTPAAVDVDITVLFDYAPVGTFGGIAGPVFANQPSINIAPRSPGNAGGSCSIPFDLYMIGGVSHMHQYGTYFEATATTGDMLYQGTEWNEPPPAVYDPPIFLPAGTRIDYRCEYDNYSNNTLTFGESAAINEMCIFSGSYYAIGGSGIGVSCLLGF